MKRTNLVLNEEVLKEATRILGAKTYSEAVNTALQEVVRRDQAQGITRFFGTGIWKGDLAEMREDRPRRRSR
jgi:Arc/MetJ family transcription regulator